MKKLFLLLKPVFIGVAFLISACLIISWAQVINTKAGNETGTSKFVPGNNEICKSIRADQINRALAKTKSKKIILNVYPIKYTTKEGKSDFDLAVYYEDQSGKQILVDKSPMANFESEVSHYVQYLKSTNVQKKDVPYGYYIKIDSHNMVNAGAIEICFSSENGMIKCTTIAKSSHHTKQTIVTDSIAKCPPDCRFLKPIISDSIGKCPPDCWPHTLLFANKIERIIQKIYKQ